MSTNHFEAAAPEPIPAWGAMVDAALSIAWSVALESGLRSGDAASVCDGVVLALVDRYQPIHSGRGLAPWSPAFHDLVRRTATAECQRMRRLAEHRRGSREFELTSVDGGSTGASYL